MDELSNLIEIVHQLMNKNNWLLYERLAKRSSKNQAL